MNIVDVDDASSKIISDAIMGSAWEVLTCHAIDSSAMLLTLIVHTIDRKSTRLNSSHSDSSRMPSSA